ncbi:MAG TPA: DUF2652 domain-containing protein [Saprospiraceae bacterium]|nr:DUF2652 domain-containing protein [Saprospiraceae bacterium]
MISKGYFVIADITGYTEFLTLSGLEEAQGILDHLFEGMVNAIKPPLQISNFQGDAILAFVPEGSFIQGQTFLEILENIYNSFVRLLEQMEQNARRCCDACDNLPKLDLKLLVHYGNYIVQNIRGREELSGPDVILVHRMAKNDVEDTTGLRSYALFTQAAIDAMEIDPRTMEMLPYTHSYLHLGETKMYVHNLRAVYESKRANDRIFVKPDEAMLVCETMLPIPPPLVWDYLTRPELAKEWMMMDMLLLRDALDGRVQRGSHFHCIRRTEEMKYTIVDWRPFEYFTIESVNEDGQKQLTSYCLRSTSEGSRITLYWKNETLEISRADLDSYDKGYTESMIKLQSMITHDLTSGKIVNTQILTQP